jgi:hypothetical protein
MNEEFNWLKHCATIFLVDIAYTAIVAVVTLPIMVYIEPYFLVGELLLD